jgi:hypothetical protein
MWWRSYWEFSFYFENGLELIPKGSEIKMDNCNLTVWNLKTIIKEVVGREDVMTDVFPSNI